MQLNYNHLFYFHVAATEGTVTAAAQKLGVTPGTVSEQLRALERALGTELFERTQTGLKLTQVGRVAFEYTSEIFSLGHSLTEVLGHIREPALRELRVGVSGGVARSTTTRFLMPLFKLADCVPTLRTADAVELLRDLRAGMLDLVLCETEPPKTSRRGLEIMLIDRTQLVAIAAPGVGPLEDWSDVAIVHYRPTTAYRKEVDAFLETRGLKPRIAAEVDDALLLVEAVIEGGFVGVVPHSVAREAIAGGRLRVLAHLEPPLAVHALYQDSTSAELVRRAVQVLAAHAASHGDEERES